MPIVTLTTDFGQDSPYVAQVKAVLLSSLPDLAIVDITHSVPAQDVQQAAYVLAEVTPHFPPQSIHMAVIDPGVGTQRRIVFAELGDQRYIAPDNGLLGLLASQQPGPQRFIELTEPRFWSPEVSDTFHGRDIMAPVVAQLAAGLRPDELGPEINDLVMLTVPKPTVLPNQVVGEIIFVDSFGNLISNISRKDLRRATEGSAVRVQCGTHEVTRIVKTYGEESPGTPVALFSSSGRLELALVERNASKQLGLGTRAPVTVTW